MLNYDRIPFRINNERRFALSLPYKQEVRGSSPRPPTIRIKKDADGGMGDVCDVYCDVMAQLAFSATD